MPISPRPPSGTKTSSSCHVVHRRLSLKPRGRGRAEMHLAGAITVASRPVGRARPRAGRSRRSSRKFRRAARRRAAPPPARRGRRRGRARRADSGKPVRRVPERACAATMRVRQSREQVVGVDAAAELRERGRGIGQALGRRRDVDADPDHDARRPAGSSRSRAGCRRAWRRRASTSFGHLSAIRDPCAVTPAGAESRPAPRASATPATKPSGRRPPRRDVVDRDEQARGEVAARRRPGAAAPAATGASARPPTTQSGPRSPARARASASVVGRADRVVGDEPVAAGARSRASRKSIRL